MAPALLIVSLPIVRLAPRVDTESAISIVAVSSFPSG